MLKSTQAGLLVAKTQRPKLPSRLIARERLLERIKAAQTNTLTIIKAAAGFGKTSLALAYASKLMQAQKRVAWVSLDPEDDEPGQFLRYVAQALYAACPEIDRQGLELIAEISLIRPLDVVRLLLNALSDVEADVFLFLDDYQTLQDRAVAECMAYFLRHAPPQLHVILTTRTEPNLPLVRLRAANQLVEIDASALRFDIEETRQFLEQEGLGSLGEATDLQEKTEGWPVMIRIITATSQQSGQEFSSYVRQLSARSRPINSHLVEMLDGLPTHIVTFLLQISVLESLCKPLCRAVANMAQADEIFEQLTSQQLLLTPLDTEGLWFRCHPLLQGFLLHRLQMEAPELVDGLHRRAYAWYAQEQRWTDAIRHAIAVGDTEQAVKWVETCAIALLRRGELLTLSAWERIFPPELMKRQIKARLAIAWGMALAVRFDEALRLVDQIEADTSTADPKQRESIHCECQTVRAVALALADDSEAALELAEASVATRASGPWTTNTALNVVLLGRLKRGAFDQCYDLPWLSFPGDDGAQNVVATVYRLCLFGLIEYAQLNQATALHHFKEALRVAREYAGPYSAAASQPAVLIAQCLYDQGRLAEARDLLLVRLPAINAACMLECVLAAYTILVRTGVVSGHRDEVEDLLTQAGELAHLRRWSRLEARVLGERTRVALADGQISSAESYVARLRHLLDRERDKSWLQREEINNELGLAQAVLAMAQHDWEEVTTSLSAIQTSAASRNNKALALECLVIQAVVSAAYEKCPAYPATVHTALAMAIPCERLNLFLDYLPLVGAAATERFYQAVLNADHAGAQALGALIETRLLPHQNQEQATPRTEAPLSPREQNILQHLLEGKSNKEIARELNLAPETIKTHLKHLFQKLNVSSRSQAVSRYYKQTHG